MSTLLKLKKKEFKANEQFEKLTEHYFEIKEDKDY